MRWIVITFRAPGVETLVTLQVSEEERFFLNQLIGELLKRNQQAGVEIEWEYKYVT
jgi:hypothetical protein